MKLLTRSQRDGTAIVELDWMDLRALGCEPPGKDPAVALKKLLDGRRQTRLRAIEQHQPARILERALTDLQKYFAEAAAEVADVVDEVDRG